MKYTLALLTLLIFTPSIAQASTAPAHLASWAKQLHDHSMAYVRETAYDPEIKYGAGQRIILEQVEALLPRANIDEWADDPVILQRLEESWEMETQFTMDLGSDAVLQINWVEDHLNLSIVQEGEDGFTFMLLGMVAIEEEEEENADHGIRLSVSPHVDVVHYQFHNEKTQEKYFPGFVTAPSEGD